MKIDEKIEYVCRSIEGVTYNFNDWTRANVDFDKLAFPVLVNLLPISGGAIIKNGTIKESRTALFAFLDLSGNDDSAVEDQSVINRMREFKHKLIIAFNHSGYFLPIDGEVLDEVTLDRSDVCVTGVVFELKLIERNGICA